MGTAHPSLWGVLEDLLERVLRRTMLSSSSAASKTITPFWTSAHRPRAATGPSQCAATDAGKGARDGAKLDRRSRT